MDEDNLSDFSDFVSHMTDESESLWFVISPEAAENDCE